MKLPTPARILWMGTYPGRIYPLERPRFANGHAYQPLDKQRDFREWLREEKPLHGPWINPVWVECYFCFEGKREADCDNLLKSVLDGLQSQGFIANDKRVVGGTFIRAMEAPESSTTILIREVIFYAAETLSASGG